MERIILDVDTGEDDMVALLLAASSPFIAIEAVVATSGNQIIEHTLENTLNVCQLLGIDAPVYEGSHLPLLRKQITGGHIHGENGLSGPVFPPRIKQKEKEYGVKAIIDLIMGNPHEITVVATGPLTDVAMALRLEPRVAEYVKRIIFMGGALKGGNITEYAEFNFFADPEAAQIVLSSEAKLVMFGLDVTLQVQLDQKRLDGYHTFEGKAAAMFTSGMDFYMESCKRVTNDYPAMHDPCCIAYLIEPSIFKGEDHTLDVEIKDEETYGMVKDRGRGGNVKVMLQADAQRFWSLLEQALENLA
ncbi:MAG: nucleoside hydrolase [Sphaerochaetaceae bacterium]